MAEASGAQVDYIVALYNELYDTDHSYLSQCRELSLSMRERQGQLFKADASRIITDLKRQVASKRASDGS